MEQILKSRYRIGEKISETPFSLTYRGVFIGTDKPVIIKIYKRGTLNSSLIKDMKQKVRELSLINHHGIAKLMDGDYGWQGFYYVREFIEGQSVQEIMAKGEKIGTEKACAIVDQVLVALTEVHRRGIVHAAISPSNIFIDNQGLVKLADFVIEGEIKESIPHKVLEVMGGAKYASPEELKGEPASPVSDIFSLGLVLYEMAAGKFVLSGKGLTENIKKLKSPVLLAKESFSGLPRFLEEIILKAIQRDPLLRFSSADEFRESLEKKGVMIKNPGDEELIKIFESAVTQYGGEEIDKESETLQDVGRVRLRWSKEKHRNWILAVIIGLSVSLGIVYAFFFGR